MVLAVEKDKDEEEDGASETTIEQQCTPKQCMLHSYAIRPAVGRC